MAINPGATETALLVCPPNPVITFVTVADVAPINTVAPVASKTAQNGAVTAGTWTGSPAPTFTYQWQHRLSGSGAAWVNSGTSNTTQALTVGQDYRALVTGTNRAGSAVGISNTITG